MPRQQANGWHCSKEVNKILKAALDAGTMIKDKTTFKLTGGGATAPASPTKKPAKKGKKTAASPAAEEKKEEEAPAAPPMAEASPKKKRAAPSKAKVSLLLLGWMILTNNVQVPGGQEGQGVAQKS